MGLYIIKNTTNIDFVRIRRWAMLASAMVILVGLVSIAVKGGLRYGIDFAGGVVVQLKFDKGMELDNLRATLEKTELPGLVVQRYGDLTDNEYLVRVSSNDIEAADARAKVEGALTSGFGETGWQVQRIEMVGPKVGQELRSKALEAIFYSLLLIAIYISGRFEQRWLAAGIMAGGLAAGIYVLKLLGMPMAWLILSALLITLGLSWYLKLNYALGAVVALIHDVLITVGVFSLLDKEFDLTIIAALLTLIGFSLNDTIIVFDRIRENVHGKASKSFASIINLSVNQTLSRTILTSGTTFLVTLVLFFFGGGVLHDFALAMLVGIFVGTYSSIYVASPILIEFGVPMGEDDNAGSPRPVAS